MSAPHVPSTVLRFISRAIGKGLVEGFLSIMARQPLLQKHNLRFRCIIRYSVTVNMNDSITSFATIEAPTKNKKTSPGADEGRCPSSAERG